MLKELALRRWTVEFADREKTNPVLLIGSKGLPRGSIQMFQIKNIVSKPISGGAIEIEVFDPTPEGQFTNGISRFTTRNIEEWPNLDVEVFKHFEVDPGFYPADIEYKSWLDKDLLCEAPFKRDSVFGVPQCEVLLPRSAVSTLPSLSEAEHLFFKDFGHREVYPQDITKWVEDNNLTQKVVSITTPTTYNGWIVWYRSSEPF